MKKTLLLAFVVLVTMQMRANHWEVENPNQYDGSPMNITCVVTINDEEQTSTQLELAAFCNGVVRGSKYAQKAPNSDRYLFRLACFGNNGDVYDSFKLYDASLDKELDYLISDYTITHDGDVHGTFTNPVVIPFTGYPSTAYSLDINAWTTNGGYYLIAPPFNDIDPAEVEGMTDDEYDLYYFNQNPSDGLEWVNYKNGAFYLQSGKGYLYAHSTEVTLTFTGTPYSGDGKVTLAKNGGQEFEGWNLVGNPYGGSVANIGTRAYYRMNADGTEVIEGEGDIQPMEGIFVIATTDNEELTFNQGAGTNTGSKIALNLVRNDRSASLVDRAVVRFDEGGTLPKFMLDATNTRVYIPQDGANYAVANHNSDNNTAVSFKAKENGSYKLKVSVENLDLEYLHLIDNQTGTDVDLLATPSYTFDANTTDQAERFRLVYAETTGIDENNNFAYFNGKTWNVNNEGQATLQVMDITGRTISSQTISGNAELSLDQPAGVYVLRLINGNDTKVQKVVVK